MRHKGILAGLFLLALILSGCGARETDGRSLHLFYPAAEYEAGGDVLCSRSVDWAARESADAAEQVKMIVELLQNREGELDFSSPIPAKAELLECTVSNGAAVLDFSAAYGRLSGLPLTVANYCITLSACQIPGVRWVQILVDGKPLPGQDRLYFSTEDVLLTSSEDVVKVVPVTLYFPDQTGALQPEKRELMIYEGENRCQRVLQALEEGPQTEGLEKLLPEGIGDAGVWMDGDICCLNFSLSDYKSLCDVSVRQESLVQGLVRSLCSLDGVEQVQIMVDGSYRAKLGVVDIENPIRP